MDGQPRIRISMELWETIPPPAQAALLPVFGEMDRLERTVAEQQVQIAAQQAQIAMLQSQVEALQKEVAELKALLKRNSSNSSKPPSTDPIARNRRPPEPPSGKRRGGQKGHPRHDRTLVPPEKVNETVDCRPTHCHDCQAPLAGDDPEPKRHQVAEIPPIEPHVVEYRLHTLTCPECGTPTKASLPPGVSQGCFGPRLASLVSLFSGAYRLSKRGVQEMLSDCFGLSISLGMICKLQRRAADLLEPVHGKLADHVRSQNVHMDETGWRENKKKAWLWVVIAPMATVFRIARSRGKDIVEQLLGDAFAHVTTCDRFKSYRHLKRLQWCWAHLRRDFQAMIDRGGAAKDIGKVLLDHSNSVFHWWHRVRDGTLTRSSFQSYMSRLRQCFRDDLEEGAACACAKTAGTCRDLLDHESWLWTFVRREGIEPTNNRAERAVRHGVLWRKSSGGTDSEQGSRFVERVLSVVATCRQQSRNVLEYLVQCHLSDLNGKPAPSLVPNTTQTSRAA
jgi:transposase